jgi:hypothetical protein
MTRDRRTHLLVSSNSRMYALLQTPFRLSFDMTQDEWQQGTLHTNKSKVPLCRRQKRRPRLSCQIEITYT